MRLRVFGGLGALATLAAVAVALRPDLVETLPQAVSVVESQPPERLLLGLGLVVGALAVWTSRGGSPVDDPPERPAARFARVGDPPEAASAADRALTGASFDGQVAVACSGDDSALRAVRDTLADTAASALARTEDRDSEQARRAVETGAWTDDPLAAAFLADDGGPDFPVTARLRAWLDPETERRRRVERTVEAIRESAETEGVGLGGKP